MNFVVSNISGFSSSGQAQVKAQEAVYNLSAALAQLKNLNPDATVIVANQYHPYAYAATEAVGIWALAAPTIVQAFQGGIDLLNMGLGAVAQNYGCAVADAYTAFSELCRILAMPLLLGFWILISIRTPMGIRLWQRLSSHISDQWQRNRVSI